MQLIARARRRLNVGHDEHLIRGKVDDRRARDSDVWSRDAPHRICHRSSEIPAEKGRAGVRVDRVDRVGLRLDVNDVVGYAADGEARNDKRLRVDQIVER